MYKNCFRNVGYGCECTAISKLSVENRAGSLSEIKLLVFFWGGGHETGHNSAKFTQILFAKHDRNDCTPLHLTHSNAGNIK